MKSAQMDRLIGKLIEKLGDEDPITRRNAAGALRLHGHRAVPAIPALVRLLDDEDFRVRQEVERALARLRAAAA
jgi:HEAT repeat protein